MNIVYIAHPIGGDVAGNLDKVRQIVRELNLTRSDILPFAPYWLDCHALDDSIPAERERGMKNGEVWIKRKLIDEVWLYGDRISSGMYSEILHAHHAGIPVYPQTPGTLKEFEDMRLVYYT